jgi:hypothetical protein
MQARPFLILAATSLAVLTATPAAAESIASSASSAGSASVGSLSDSISGSSDASSDRKTAAAGTYRVLAVRPLAGALQAVDLQAVDLQAVDLQAVGSPAGEAQAPGRAARRFTLTLPAAAAELLPGALVQVMPRPYGLAFARADAGGVVGQPFFLALAQDWQDALTLRRVRL